MMKRLNRKLLLMMMGVMALVILLQAAFLYTAIRRYNRNEIFRENKYLAESIAQMLSERPSLITSDYLEQLLTMNQVKGAVVGASRGVLYTNLEDVAIRRLLSRPEIISARGIIKNDQDETIGQVFIIEQEQGVRRVKAIFFIALGISGVSGIIAVLAAAFLLKKMVTKPLDTIVYGISQDTVITLKNKDWSGLVEGHNRSQESRRRFFREASHAMKAPLMNIQGAVEGMEDELYTLDEGSQMINSEVARLKDSADQLIRSGKALEYVVKKSEWTNIAMNSFLVEMVRLFPKKIECKVILNGEVFLFDEQLLRIIMENLIQNASRYAKHQVTIEYQSLPYPMLVVKDDGEGVDPVIEEKLFERFVKGKGGHTGLGLSIVKDYVQRTGGSIDYEYDMGAKFTLKWQ